MELPHLRSPSAYLPNSEFAIGTMRNHGLTRLKTKLHAVELHRNDIRLEGHQVGDAANFSIGLTIRPCGETCVTDVVVAAQTFVRTKALMFHESQSGFVDVGARNVPPRGKAGLL